MADDKINSITDIRYGQMNPLEGSQGTAYFDTATITATGAIQANNINQFVPNLLQGKGRWPAIVLRSTQQRRPWLASSFQRTLSALDRTTNGTELYYSYKIIIIEKDAAHAAAFPERFTLGPNGELPDENLINICRDAVAPLGKNWGNLDYGTPIEVIFENHGSATSRALATVVEVFYDGRIPLQPSDTPDNMFKNVISGGRRDRGHYGTTGTVGAPPGPSLTAPSGTPIKMSEANVRNGQQLFQDLATYGDIQCVALRHGIIVNALNESKFDPNVPGDPPSSGRQGGPGSPGGIYVDYVPGAWSARKGVYCSFGLFQMNVCVEHALGWQMLKWAGVTNSSNEEKLKVLTGESGYKKQIQFVAHKLKTQYSTVLDCSKYTTSQEYHDWWLHNIERPAAKHRPARSDRFVGSLRGLGLEPVV